MLRIADWKGVEVLRSEAGAFGVYDRHEYLVESSEPLPPNHPFLKVLPLEGGRVGNLCFENYVGLAELAGARFRVRNSKLSEESFGKLLADVIEDFSDLAFAFGSPTALPFDSNDAIHRGVLYHSLAYLRYIMLQEDRLDRLSAQFLAIARRPHRVVEVEPAWIEISRVARLGDRGLQTVTSRPEALQPLPPGSRLAETALGRRLRHPKQLFPGSVFGERRIQSNDTNENRLIRHFLESATFVVSEFRGRFHLDPLLKRDLTQMDEELRWMLSFDFLGDVGPLAIVPAQSTVLQRRDGYRELFQHFLRFQQSATLGQDKDLWERLLELKDVALLYEVWAFFAVKRCLDELLGEGIANGGVAADDLSRSVGWGAQVTYADGSVQLSYNRTFGHDKGSYSIPLRPDIVVRVQLAELWRCLVLDAKFRFDGLKVGEEPNPEEWERNPTRIDLAKMHTYRDALREADGAFVLYPGTQRTIFPVDATGPGFRGVGAIPLHPEGSRLDLSTFLREFLAHYGKVRS